MPAISRKIQLQDLLKHDPEDPFLLYALAMELESEGDTTGAIAQLQSLLTTSPEYVPGYLQLGQLQLQAGNTEDAKITLQMGMQTAFKQADHHAYQEMEGILAGILN